jgi:AcrR family transcriptional regulator
MAEELVKVLNSRVGPPAQNEREAMELIADTAMRCVNFQGEERPTMAEIVNKLEVALALF